MIMDREIINDFLKGFDDNYYPKNFLEKYEPVECLAQNQMGETLLVRDRFDTDYIAKCYTDASLLSQTSENELLKKLHHSGLPELVEEFQNKNMLCVVRQYARGIPLSRLEEPLSETQIINVGIQLCEILAYLHGQKPPIIHRDIKPQNIVIDESGKVTLIDFGISREYDESARADTVFFGTQEFAPPEQYGFSQTDNRADIFSLGVVLAWLLTGRTSLKALRLKNRRLEHIVRKCMAFAPKDRYRDAEQVRKALQNADGHKKKKMLLVLGIALVSFTMLTAGFAVGRFTDIRPPVFYNNSYAYFSEPLIEKAVRLQLGKAEGEPITTEELDKVTELYIYADQAVKTLDNYYNVRPQVESGTIAAGNIRLSNINDIIKLKNLQKLGLGRQDITDISVLERLKNLKFLDIIECPIESIQVVGQLSNLEHFALNSWDYVTDISPLSRCPKLKELVLTNCRAEDYSALSKLGDIEYLHMEGIEPKKFLPYLQGKRVRQLKIGYTSIDSISSLSGIDGLEELMMYRMQLASLEGIQSFTGLTYVWLNGMPNLDLSPLRSLPYLKTVVISEDMIKAVKALEGTGIEVIYE